MWILSIGFIPGVCCFIGGHIYRSYYIGRFDCIFLSVLVPTGNKKSARSAEVEARA